MQVTRAFTGVRPVRSITAPAPRRVAVVVQAKPTKLADFSSLSNEELVKKVEDLKLERARLKWVQRVEGRDLKPGEKSLPPADPEKVPKGHLHKHVRRQIAQCFTLIRQRQIAEGIDRRQARSIEKAAQLEKGMLQKNAVAKSSEVLKMVAAKKRELAQVKTPKALRKALAELK